MKVLILDNYDSFTYNLAHAVEAILDKEVDVIRNDEIKLDELEQYSHIILSPGPGIPDEAGMLKSVIQNCSQTHKILGVCLGLQAIGEVFGADLINLDHVFHGIQTEMTKTDHESPIFSNVPNPFQAGRYHSWVINKSTIPEDFNITAIDDTGEIMAIQHQDLPIYAVQFHPESILTPEGNLMIENFLKIQ